MPRLLELYGNNQEITSMALANPLMALQMAGVVLSEDAKKEVELHVRFGKDKAAEVVELRKKIEESAGENFDPYNNESVAAIILKAASAMPSAVAEKKTKSSVNLPGKDQLISMLNTLPVSEGNKIKDPLSEMEQLHPVVPLLMQLRKMDMLYPLFSTETNLNKVKAFIKKSPLKKVTFRLSRK